MPASYKTTSVPVERSKEAIRQLLIKFGVRGIQFAESFDTGEINVRFAKDVDSQLRTVSVTMIVPDPPQPKRARRRRQRWVRGRIVYDKSPQEKKEQMARATYRALHYWLKSQFEAVEFGLLTFEDVFLSHFEWMVDGRRSTIGAFIKPRLSSGNLLAAPSDDAIEGKIIR